VRLLLGEFVSSVGDWLYLVALLVVVYDEARDPLLLGLIGGGRILPYALLSVPAGILADRVDRRLILVTTDIARGLVMLALTAVVAFGGSTALLVALAILATCFSAFFGPASSAYVPTVVGDEADLAPANSAWATLDNLAFVIGPALAGVLIAVGGLAVAFLLNAVTFAIVAAVLLTLPSTRPAPGGADGVDAATSAGDEPSAPIGWRGMLDRVRTPLVLDLGTSFAGGGIGVLTVVIAVDALGAGEEATGYLNAATGVGGVVAGLIAGAFVLRRLDLPLVAGALVGAVAFVILGVVDTLIPAMLAMGTAVGAFLLLDVINVTLIQRSVPDELRGRAMGLMSTTSTVAMILGAFLSPLLAAVLGLPLALTLLGLSVAVVALVAVADANRTGALLPPAVPADLLDLLRLSPLSGLPPARLEAAARAMRREAVPAGRRVIEQGAEADRFYLIEQGAFRAEQADDGAEARQLRQMQRGEVFGQIGLLAGGRRTASVVADTDGVLQALDRDTFLELVSAGPGLGTRLLDLHRGVLARG
jgi:MFS family permease